MTTENKDTNQDGTDSSDDNQRQYTEIEQQALDQGWRPKEDYEGAPEKWVSADIFVARAPLFEHLDVQKKEIKELRKALKDVARQTGAIRAEEHKRALADLKAEKRAALIDGDADAVIEADEKINLVKDEQRRSIEAAKVEMTEEVQTRHPEFTNWVNQNSWYDHNAPMKAFADALGVQLAREGLTPKQVLVEVGKQVREEFPNKFKNQNRDKPGAVESSTAKTSSGKNDEYVLSDLERQVMKTVVRTGVMTEKEYIKQLKANSGVS